MAMSCLEILFIILHVTIVAYGNDLSLTFDASDSKCTAQCSTCSGMGSDDNNGTPDDNGPSDEVIADILNTTSANYQALQKALQELARVSGTLSSLKTTTTSTSATVNDLLLLVEELHNNTLGSSEPLPTSCEDIKRRAPSSPSGEYLIQTPSGSSQYVYCYMEELCSSDDGWMRLAYLDMTDPSQSCPPEFKQIFDPNGNTDVRACARQETNAGSCDSITFPSHDISYSQVCGKVIGYYRHGNPGPSSFNNEGIDTFYVDGVSITHGSPRQHVWTFSAGNEDRATRPEWDCPCNTGNTGVVIPSFVENDYFCESAYPGNAYTYDDGLSLIPGDPLWDGQHCQNLEASCCEAAGLPWFNKVLPSPTTDFLELRICCERNTVHDTPIGIYEIYVK